MTGVQVVRLGTAAAALSHLPAAADEAAAQALGAEFVLGTQDGALRLWRPGAPETPLVVQFDEGQLGYRLSADRVRHERLVRAVGKLQHQGWLLDATAGLARDAALLAQAGWQVMMFEQNPVLAALIADGLARSPAFAARMQLQPVDALQALQQPLPVQPEVVYLDPMFPEREKTALVKKELAWLQLLNEAPTLAQEQALLDGALAVASRRVVVKRPLPAPPLAGLKPASTLAGKTVRFDIYPVSVR